MFHRLRQARDIEQAVSCITSGVPAGILRGKTGTILCKHLRLQTALRARTILPCARLGARPRTKKCDLHASLGQRLWLAPPHA